MADFLDDYAIIGASGDNFDCDATGGWGTSGNASSVATNSGSKVEGSNSLDLTASDVGDSSWYHDVSSGNRFKITEKDLHFWFKYVKGKGANYLVQDGTAVVIRLFFGGTSKYADYRCTATGDLELKFGWQLLSASGKSLRGGSTGGGHNNGSDYDLDIYRVELKLNFANKNDTPLGMDCWFAGTIIKVTSGTSSSPVSFSDIAEYSNKDRTAFPLGLVNKQMILYNIKCGIQVGDGSSGSGHSGYIKDYSKFLLFNQLSEEVKHPIIVKNYSTLDLGLQVSGSESSYYVDGCQIVLPEDRYSDFSVENGGTLKLYDTKIYRWRYLYFGASSDSGSTIELHNVDIDSCETLFLRASTQNISYLSVHNNVNSINDYAVNITKPITSMDYLYCYRCSVGAKIDGDFTLKTFNLTDNTVDLKVLSGKTVSLIDSVFSESKLEVC